MRRFLLLLALVPGAAAAQTASVDPATVRQCLASAKTGQIAPPCIGDAAKACQAKPGGQTTLGMSECLQAETAVWDGLLNSHYKKLRTQLRKEGKELPKALLKAQRAWIAFRDAQCALDYDLWAGGSIRVVMGASCQMRMTATRTIQLRDMEPN